eukprot:3276012-Rhodomonas_salina.1
MSPIETTWRPHRKYEHRTSRRACAAQHVVYPTSERAAERAVRKTQTTSGPRDAVYLRLVVVLVVIPMPVQLVLRCLPLLLISRRDETQSSNSVEKAQHHLAPSSPNWHPTPDLFTCTTGPDPQNAAPSNKKNRARCSPIQSNSA